MCFVYVALEDEKNQPESEKEVNYINDEECVLWFVGQEKKRKLAVKDGWRGSRCFSLEEESVLWKERTDQIVGENKGEISEEEFQTWRARKGKVSLRGIWGWPQRKRHPWKLRIGTKNWPKPDGQASQGVTCGTPWTNCWRK